MTGPLPPDPPRPRFAAAAALLFLCGGCGGGTLVVLAPDPGGTTGAVTVSGPSGSVAMDSPRMATRVGGAGSPSPPSPMDGAAIGAIFGDALSAQPRPPVHYLLHFEKDLQLDADSERLLQGILDDIRQRGSKDVSVVGHADTVGSAEYNMALSTRRADRVREILVRGGVDPASVRSSSHGKENPLVKTGDNVSERRNRRVEVVVR